MASTTYLKNAPLKDKMPESWDVAVCHKGEANLYEHHKSCHKHPDHKEFIPVHEFNITHLPTDYQDNDIVEYIKLVAQLTVRLNVRYVSPDRPATVPGTDTPYPFYNNRGLNVMRVGTGMITDVTGSWIIIKTATHVVFDEDEAKHTSFHLFYDKGDQPAVCDTAIEVNLKESRFSSSNAIVDESCIRVYLFKNQQIHKITSSYFKMLELRTKIAKTLSERSLDSQNQPLTFIVSHPHGCSKTISIGRCVEVDDNLDDVRFLYTTNTCPGSSGAAVICLGKEALNLYGVHSGTWKDDAGLNLGSSRYVPIVQHAPYIDEECHYIDRRLPFPNSDVLGPRIQELNYNLMYDYFSLWFNLCVDVEVNYVSEQRPEFWPGSELTYPWYKKRGSREERQGCGWVDRVDIYSDESSFSKTCDCNACRNSSTPETNFAHIFILTSTSLVFDQTEGRKTKCFEDFTLFASLWGTQSVSSDVETDRSQLVFVTHHLNFAKKLSIFLENVSFLKEKIQDKFSPYLSANPVSIKIRKYHRNTIGRCVRVDNHLVYTNEDGPADVGAPIIVLGNKHLHVDVSAHSEQFSLDPRYGYSRYLDYQYKSTQLKYLLPD